MEQPPIYSFEESVQLLSNPEMTVLVKECNDKYLYWTEVKYLKCPANVIAKQLWGAVRVSRQMLYIYKWPRYSVYVPMTNEMLRLCHHFDMNFGGSWGNGAIIPTTDRERYLVSSVMEEAIASSQMEGAATTRRVAKDMLRKNLSPKGRSEQMIYNNYASIKFISEHKDEDLSPQLFLQIHRLMTNRTLGDKADEGRFRTNDDVVVENSITHEVVHTPPTFSEILPFVEDLCHFANTDDSDQFIHPIIKAIIIHFMVSYVHPFVDGNGRTARALFYWYMLKKGYWLTEFLSISRIIYRSKTRYEKAFLHAEKDGCDMGYFITYHLRVLDLAFKELRTYIQKKIMQRQNDAAYTHIEGINERQAAMLSILKNSPKTIFTIRDVQSRFSVSQPTARTDVERLVTMGLMERVRVNKVKSNYVRATNFESLLNEMMDNG